MIDTSIVNKNVDGFKFVETLGNFINNQKFKLGFDEYQLGRQTKDSYLWHALSAIGEDYAEIIYENVLNYLDNVSNVDLCNIKALQSMMKIVGIQYDVLQAYGSIPVEIARLMDLLSINYKYLLDSKTFKDEFIEILKDSGCIKQAVQDNDKLSAMFYNHDEKLSTITDNSFYVDEHAYSTFLYNIYYKALSSFIYMKYTDGEVGFPTTQQYIYEYIQDDILAGQVQSDVTIQTTYEAKMSKLKIQYGIDKDFDQEKIVDDIENGYDSFDNYNIFQQEVLQQEVERRQVTYSYDKAYANSPQTAYGSNLTRFSYYREKKVKEYFAFVENTYNNLIIEQGIKNAVESTNPSTIEQYDNDVNYFDVNQIEKKTLLSYDDKIGKVEIQTNFIQAIAQLLQQQTLEIAQIRDQVKLQIRKSYMRGTFLLISYVVNEFLKYSISNKYGGSFQTEDGVYLSAILSKSITEGDNVELIEYYDDTEYFNITRDVDAAAKYSETVSEKFWDNVYNKIGQTTEDLPLDEIDAFYKKQLKLERNQVNDLVNFLSIIYEYGANNSYISRRTDEFTTLIPGRDIGDKPFYIGDPYNEISTIQDDILSVNKIHDGVDKYIETGWVQTIDTTINQLSSLSTYVFDYYWNEISTANEELEQSILDQTEKDFDEASQIADKFGEVSASYEDLKINSRYKYYLNGNRRYIEPTNYKPYFPEKIFNFKLSVLGPNGIVWRYSKLNDKIDEYLRNYNDLSNELYTKLFQLSVWQTGSPFECWPYYSPNFENELTTVTNDLKSYLMSQVQVQHDGALQHLQNHYDALLGYKEDLAIVLNDCKGAVAKYEAMRAGIEAASMTSMDEDLDDERIILGDDVYEVTWQWYDSHDKSQGGYYEETATNYHVTEEWSQHSDGISPGDSIQTKLQKLEERSQYLKFGKRYQGPCLTESNESPDENTYFSERTAVNYSYKIKYGEGDDAETITYYEYYFKYKYVYETMQYYVLEEAKMPWAGAYSQSTASEIIATLEKAVVDLNSIVTLINSELDCIGSMITKLDTYNSDADGVCDDVEDAYSKLMARLDSLDNYIKAGIELSGWQSLTSDSNLMPYKYRLQRINAINLSVGQECNIRYIDTKFFNLVIKVNKLLEDNAEYFDEYVNNDADRLDYQLSAISAYMCKRDAQCSAEVLSALNDISASYLSVLQDFNQFSLLLTRSVVDSIADNYTYSLSTILYRHDLTSDDDPVRDEIYSKISAQVPPSPYGLNWPTRFKDCLDFLLSGNYVDSSWGIGNPGDKQLSGVLYWLSSASNWFEQSISVKIEEKIPTLPEYIEMTNLIDLAKIRYAPRISDEQQLLIDKLDQIVEELNKEIAHISSQIPFYDKSHEIYLKYNGTDIGYDPFYCYKNQAYSSYQIHPYLYNFVEKSNIVYPLANNFFVSFGDEYEKELYAKSIDAILGKYGNIKDLWKSGLFDWTSYQTKYERQANLKGFAAGSTNPNIGFTGLFYPPALCALLNDRDKFLQDVQDNSPDSYYYHLNLTNNQCQKIYNQLLAYEHMISCVATAQYTHNLSGEFDIYRYAEDCMGNSIFLLKSYKHLYAQHKDDPNYTPSYHEKRNTLGEIWMRVKDNPLAFPAFDVRNGYGDVAQYSVKKQTNSYAKDINSYILSLDLFFKNHETITNDLDSLSTAVLTRDTIYEYQTSDSLENENDKFAPEEAQHLRCFYDFETDVLNQSLLLVVPFKTGTCHQSLYFTDDWKNRINLKSSMLRYADSSIIVGYLGDHQLFNSTSDQTYVYNFSIDEYKQNNVNVNNIANKQMLINGTLEKSMDSRDDTSSLYFYEFIGFTKYKTYVYAVFVKKMVDSSIINGSIVEDKTKTPCQAFTFIEGLKSRNKPRLTLIYTGYKCHLDTTEKTVTSEDLMYDCYDWHTDMDKTAGVDYTNASNVAIGGGNGILTIGFVTERFNKVTNNDYANNSKIVNFAEYSSQIESYNALEQTGMNLEYPRSTALIQTNDSQHINIYNSFDSFVQHIVNVSFKFVGNNLKYNSTKYFNLNSDIGYLPQYVDVQGTTKYCNNTALCNASQWNIELLGPEKSDVAFTPVIQMTTDEKYGRVVEDYKEYNKMSAFNETPLTIQANAMTAQYEFDLKDIYVNTLAPDHSAAKIALAEQSWDDLIQTPELLRYKYILYNTKYLSQPILKGNLSDVLPNGYYYQSSELYDLLSGEEIIGPNSTTYQNINLTNHIDNISAIGMEVIFDEEDTLLPSKMLLTVKARMPDSESDREIEANNFYMLLYVKNNVKSYEYYHLFENANKNILNTNRLYFEDAWGVDLAHASVDLSDITTARNEKLFEKKLSSGKKYDQLSAMAEFKYSEGDPINREFPYIDAIDVEDEITIVENDSQSIYFFAVDSYKILDLGVFKMKTYEPEWVDNAPNTAHTYFKKINTALPKYRDFYNRALVIEATYNMEKCLNDEHQYEIVQYFNYKNFTNPQYVHIDWPSNATQPPNAYVCDSTSDEIKHTYLVLRPGQSGRLDIRIDFVDYQKLTKKAINQSIVGASSQILTSYYIMNVSDEKPKFIISRKPFAASEGVIEVGNYELEDQYYAGMAFRYAMMVIEETRSSSDPTQHLWNYVAMSQLAFKTKADERFDYPTATTVDIYGAGAAIVYPNVPANLLNDDESKEFFASNLDLQASYLSVVIDMKSEALDISVYDHWEWYNSHCSNSHIGYIPKKFFIAFSNDKTRWYKANSYYDIKNAITTTNYAMAYRGELKVDE